MRLALLSDIHGHAVALDAVLADMQRQDVDSIICLGDVATIGPQPKEVFQRLNELHIPCIMGNHDAALLTPEAAAEYQVPPPLHETLAWCAAQLTPEDFAYLRGFQPQLEVALGPSASLLCYHGSRHSTTDLILATTPADDLDRLLADPGVGAGPAYTVMAGGHSHLQHRSALLLNPGSVGSAFRNAPLPGVIPTLLPWAEYAIVQYDHDVLSLDLRRVPFDIDAFHARVAHSDLPIREWWLGQYSGKWQVASGK
jgi:predicted phosphodiesterase